MTGEAPKVSVVVPAYNEGVHITPVLDRIFESVRLQCEVLVVVDSEDDSTVSVVADYACKEPRLRIAGANGEWIVWAALKDLKEAWRKPMRW